MQHQHLYLFIIIFCFMNLCVSVFIAKRDDLERFQIMAQIILVWLIPIIGAIGLWMFHRSNDDNSKQRPVFGGGTTDNGDEPPN